MKYISLLITIILLNSSNLALAQEKYELRLLTNANPTGALFPSFGKFAQNVKRRTNGVVNIKIIVMIFYIVRFISHRLFLYRNIKAGSFPLGLGLRVFYWLLL